MHSSANKKMFLLMLFAAFYFRFVDLMLILIRKKRLKLDSVYKSKGKFSGLKNITDSAFSFLHIYIFKITFCK